MDGNVVSVSKEELNVLSSDFLNEQVDKCNRKISEKDFYGAITNARSMGEELLLSIEKEIIGERGSMNGDMSKLYKGVSKLVNFNEGKQGLATPLK